MTIRILLIALGLAWVATLVGIVWMVILAGILPHQMPYLLTDMDVWLRACAVLSVISAAVGIIGVRAGAGRLAGIGIGGAFGCGVLGGLLGAANAQYMLSMMNGLIPFADYAPTDAEALIVLLVGLTGALLGLGLLSRRRPRQA